MKDEIRVEDIRLSLLMLWKKRNIVIAVTILFFVAGYLFTMNKPVNNIYRADASIYSATMGSYQQSLTGANAMKDYIDIVSSNKVCEKAEELMEDIDISAEMIQKMVDARFSDDSYILNIYAYSSDYYVSIKVANAVAQAFVSEMRGITGNDAIKLLDEADNAVISSYGGNNILKLRIVFCIVGLFLCCVIIIIKEIFTDKIKTINQCILEDNNDIMGVIPYIEKTHN